MWFRCRRAAGQRGGKLGATVYELGPGNWLPFHFHHGSEEFLVVLRGRPTLRTGDGSRELAEGEALHFPRGPDGAHGLANETDEPVRLMAFTLVTPGPLTASNNRDKVAAP